MCLWLWKRSIPTNRAAQTLSHTLSQSRRSESPTTPTHLRDSLWWVNVILALETCLESAAGESDNETERGGILIVSAESSLYSVGGSAVLHKTILPAIAVTSSRELIHVSFSSRLQFLGTDFQDFPLEAFVSLTVFFFFC